MDTKPKDDNLYRIITQQRGNKITLECMTTKNRIDILVSALVNQPNLLNKLPKDDLDLVHYIAEEMATYG